MLSLSSAFGALDNKGKEFILGFLPNHFSPEIELHLTGDISTSVVIEYPVGTYLTTAVVTPGNITEVSIPVSSTNWTANSSDYNSVRAYSDDEFVCYQINRAYATSDAALALPVDVLNTEYVLASYRPVAPSDSEFLIIAAYDNTTITITPSVNLSGHLAGTPFNVLLNRGQGYFNYGTSSGAGGDITGTIVQSDRPVYVINGNKCTYIPPTYLYCDHIFEVAHPIQSWGKNIPVSNLPQRTGSIYRILASVDGTTVTMDGSFLVSLNRGQFYETSVLSGEHHFQANHPIFVIQFMTGDTYPGSDEGDPAMGNMIPSDQYLRSYTFSPVGSDQFETNYVTIIAEYSDINSNTMLLDGSPLAPALFSPVPGTTLGAATVLLSSGSHTTSSPNPHGITVQGYNDFDSYLYPGGAAFQFINPVGDENPPICSLDNFGDYATGMAKDDRPSEDENNNDVLDDGEDLNGNDKIDVDKGIFLVELEPGSSNITLTVDPFTPGDPVVTYTLNVIDNSMDASGTVKVTDGAGNTCTSEYTYIANQPPVADAGDDATYECNSPNGTEVTLDGSGSSDPNEDELTYTWRENNVVIAGPTNDPTTTVALGVGVHTIELELMDPHGETSTDELIITIEDNTAPTVSCSASPNSLWPPNHKYVNITLSTTIEDACDENSTIELISVTSNEADNGLGDGDTPNDIVIVNNNQLKLRAERSGRGSGRNYTIVFKVTDASGNESMCSTTVTVPHSRRTVSYTHLTLPTIYSV